MNGNHRSALRLRLLGFLAACIVAAAPGAVAQDQPAAPVVIEVYPLDGNNWVLGAFPDGDALQAEITRSSEGWKPNGHPENDPRWQKVWESVLHVPDPATQWKTALQGLATQPLPSYFKLRKPDRGVFLRRIADDRARLTFVGPESLPSFDFAKRNNLWTKTGSIDPNGLLALPNGGTRAPVWQQIFGQAEPGKGAQWPTFWSSWIANFSAGPGRMILYRDKDGKPLRLALVSLSENEWQSRLLGFPAAPPVQQPPVTSTTPGAPCTPSVVPPKPDNSSWFSRHWWGVLIGSVFLVGLFLAWYFRDRLRQELALLLSYLLGKLLPGVSIAEKFIHELDAAVRVALPSEDSETDTALKGLAVSALDFSRTKYLAVADQIKIPILEPRKADDEKAKDELVSIIIDRLASKEEGKLSRANVVRAQQLFLAAVGELEEKRKQLSQAEENNASLETKYKELEGRLTTTEKDLAAKDNVVTQQTNQLVRQTETVKQLEEKRDALKKDVEAKEGLLVTAKAREKDLDGKLTEAKNAHQLLKVQHETLRKEKEEHETRAKKAESDLQRLAKAIQETQSEKVTLDQTMGRLEKADDYLRNVHLAFWDSCQNPGASAMLLYNAYLGLYQVLLSAVQKQPLLERAGWLNIRNLMRRIGTVPGLENWQQSFGQRVFSEIDQIEVPAQNIVNPRQDDKERFVNTVILQKLLSGEVQLGGEVRERFDLDRLRGWPLFFRVDKDGVWGAS
jgi:hypothetical protein